MRSRLGVTVEWSTKMIGFSQAEHHDGLTAILEHGEGTLKSVSCSHLTAAEGARCTVRETLACRSQAGRWKSNMRCGDFYIDSERPDSDLHVFSSEHGFPGMFPMGNKRYRLIASSPIGKPSQDTEPSLEELQQLYKWLIAKPVAAVREEYLASIG